MQSITVTAEFAAIAPSETYTVTYDGDMVTLYLHDEDDDQQEIGYAAGVEDLDLAEFAEFVQASAENGRNVADVSGLIIDFLNV